MGKFPVIAYTLKDVSSQKYEAAKDQLENGSYKMNDIVLENSVYTLSGLQRRIRRRNASAQ